MRSHHLVDPDLLPLFKAVPPFDLRADTLASVRQQADALAQSMFGSDDEALAGLELSERYVPGAPDDPDVRILILRPADGHEGSSRPLIFETHGGGHVMGSPQVSARIYADIVRQLDAVMVLVDYRLSPEAAGMAPLEDCYAALRWAYAHAETLGVDRDRIAVTGSSAGATLAAGVALLARDRGGIEIAHLHLVQPMLDDRTCVNPDISPFVGEYCWTRENNAFGWASRLGVAPGSDDVSPYVAPGRMEDLSGLPPTFISCGALDLFVEESLAFVRRLIQGGVPAELHVYPGAPHGAPFGSTGPLRAAMDRDDLAAWRQAFASPS